MLLAVTQEVALLLLFVVMPLVLAAGIGWLVYSRSEPYPEELRTSSLVRDGSPAEATILDWRSPAQSFLDRHPMVTFRVALGDDASTEMNITQSVPKDLLRVLQRGMTVDVRLSSDGQTGAIEFG